MDFSTQHLKNRRYSNDIGTVCDCGKLVENHQIREIRECRQESKDE